VVTLRHDIAGATHQGRRDHNEDCYVADADHGLALVADGMGGHAGGEIASAIARDVVCSQLRRGQSLASAVLDAHRAIQQAAAEGAGRQGMGSTVVVAQFAACEYQLAWVGDSRAYLWTGASLLQITRDHSFVEGLLASAAISLDEARHHPQRHLITQALGAGDEPPTVDRIAGELGRDDVLLLCSDGLNDELSDATLAQLIAAPASDSAALARRLVDAAVAAGGRDNVSAVVVRAAAGAPAEGWAPAAVRRTSLDSHTQRKAAAQNPIPPPEPTLLSILVMPLGICTGLAVMVLAVVLWVTAGLGV
jgi:protein phosphatase